MSLLEPLGTLIRTPTETLRLPRFRVVIPINPPNIVTISGPEFTVDMKKMEVYMPYRVDLLGVSYLIWKDRNGSLVIKEVA